MVGIYHSSFWQISLDSSKQRHFIINIEHIDQYSREGGAHKDAKAIENSHKQQYKLEVIVVEPLSIGHIKFQVIDEYTDPADTQHIWMSEDVEDAVQQPVEGEGSFEVQAQWQRDEQNLWIDRV